MSLLSTLKFILQHPLNRQRKTKAFLRFLKWQIGSRLVPGEVVYHWIGDARFIVRPGEVGLTQNIYCGLHEFQDMAYVLHALNGDDLFVDVGANVGSYTILACAVRGATGYCFEPIPSTYYRLVRNIRLNEIETRVKALNVGISDKEGELLFTSGQNSTNHVVANGEMAADAIKVKVLPLDSVLVGESPSLIKIDVEGFETLVINGLLKTLENKSLHSVIMELNDSGRRYSFHNKDIMDTMYGFGFQMYIYEPFSRKLQSASPKNPKSGNALFLRNLDFINQRIAVAPRIKVGSSEI